MAPKVTLRTIAEHTGLSVPTVSQILNNRRGNYSSAETRERVLKTARDLHYRPNFGYQLMHGKKTGTVAMIVSSERFYNEQKHRMFQTSLMCQLTRAGYNAYLSVFTDSVEHNLEVVRNLLHRGVERVILHGHPVGIDEIISELEQHEVCLTGTHDICPRHVANGSAFGRKRILEYIISRVGEDFKVIHPGGVVHPGQGHIRPLRWIFPDVPQDELERRFICKIPFNKSTGGDDWIHNIMPSRNEWRRRGYDAMEQLYRSGNMPRAVMFSNDTYAIGGGMWLMEKGHEQFRDRVILAGYNNDAELDSFPLPIISGEDDVSAQTKMLFERCGDMEPCQIVIQPRIFFRKSAGKARFPHWDCEVEQL